MVWNREHYEALLLASGVNVSQAPAWPVALYQAEGMEQAQFAPLLHVDDGPTHNSERWRSSDWSRAAKGGRRTASNEAQTLEGVIGQMSAQRRAQVNRSRHQFKFGRG